MIDEKARQAVADSCEEATAAGYLVTGHTMANRFGGIEITIFMTRPPLANVSSFETLQP